MNVKWPPPFFFFPNNPFLIPSPHTQSSPRLFFRPDLFKLLPRSRADLMAANSGPTRLMNRQMTVRDYARLVKESLATRVSKLICAIFLSLLFTVGLISFILWLAFRPHRPRFYIHEFSVLPGFNQESGFENAEITFHVTARNPNQNIGIFYDSVRASVYYKDQRIGSVPVVKDPFYQEPKNTTDVSATLSGATLTVSSRRWSDFLADRGRGSVVLRLDLTSAIRFKISTWASKRHRMHANCGVAVGAGGFLLPTSKDKRCPVYFI